MILWWSRQRLRHLFESANSTKVTGVKHGLSHHMTAPITSGCGPKQQVTGVKIAGLGTWEDVIDETERRISLALDMKLISRRMCAPPPLTHRQHPPPTAREWRSPSGVSLVLLPGAAL